MNAFYRIHVEHDPSQQQVVRLCADHLRMAESCLMVDERDVPQIDSECFCPTCHFCDILR